MYVNTLTVGDILIHCRAGPAIIFAVILQRSSGG